MGGLGALAALKELAVLAVEVVVALGVPPAPTILDLGLCLSLASCLLLPLYSLPQAVSSLQVEAEGVEVSLATALARGLCL